MIGEGATPQKTRKRQRVFSFFYFFTFLRVRARAGGNTTSRSSSFSRLYRESKRNDRSIVIPQKDVATQECRGGGGGGVLVSTEYDRAPRLPRALRYLRVCLARRARKPPSTIPVSIPFPSPHTPVSLSLSLTYLPAWPA